MIVATCQHEKRHKHGITRQGEQRFKCALCGKTFIEKQSSPLGGMRTDLDQAATAISMLLEWMSVRSVQLLAGLCSQAPAKSNLSSDASHLTIMRLHHVLRAL